MKTPLLLSALVLVLGLGALLASSQDSPAAAGRATPLPSPSTAPATQPVEVTAEGCIREWFSVESPSMKRSIKAVVLLPPGYREQTDRRYPVLYTLHGMGAPYATYSDMAPLRKALRDRPMIVVAFDGDRAGWYIDSPRKPGNQFQTFFFDEFLPYIDARYRTNGQRGVEGFSMGGFGAFHYLLCKPEMFCSASAHSGAFFRLRDANTKTGPGFLQELLGPPGENRDAYERLDIGGRIEQRVKSGARLPPMLLHCGTEDGLLANNRDFCRFLAEQNKLIAAETAKDSSLASEADPAKKAKALAALVAARRLNFLYMESPGGHNWAFWRGSSEVMIDFHWRSFRDAPKAAGGPAAK